MAIFARRAGTVVIIPAGEDQSPRAGLVQVEGKDNLKSTGSIIISRITTDGSVAFKATPTIGGPKYVNIFGDNLININISIIMFAGEGCSEESEQNGILDSLKFYASNRIKPNEAPITKIVYGGATLAGFLIGYKADSTIRDGLPFHSGVLSMSGWIDDDWYLNRV